MPIPKLSGELTREQIIQEYAKEPYNWHKKLVFDWIEVNQRNGTINKTTYEFIADSMPCTGLPDCPMYQLSFINLRPTGIYKTCANCRRTEGPLSFEEGRVLKRVTVDINEAWEVLQKNGQKPPIGLAPTNTRNKFTIKTS